jgi:hypothetical protein
MTGTAYALVTGASSGIGLELARLLAGRKRNLYLVARSADRLNEAADELKGTFGVDVRQVAVDLTLPDAIDRIADAVAADDAVIDFLVNNAGVGLLGRFHETRVDEQRDLIRLNVETLVGLTHRFIPQMIKRRTGAVLNVASMAAFTPGPLMASYYASKAFVLSFSESLAAELREYGITVTALCPGPVPTGFQSRAGFPQAGKTSLPSISAQKVARIGLKGVESGKRVVIPGIMNKVLAAASRVVPRSLSGRAVYRVQSSRLGLEQSPS